MASDLNRVSLMGRMGCDPEVKTFDNGDRVCNFRIATGDKWKDRNTGEDRERTEWHQIVVYGDGLVKLAEKWLRKGNRVHLEGSLRTRKWQDQQGNDRYSTEVVLSGFGARLDIIDWPDGDGREKGQRESYGNLPGNQGQSGGYDGYGQGGQAMDDSIPFAPECRI